MDRTEPTLAELAARSAFWAGAITGFLAGLAVACFAVALLAH